jgi:hypothetical protein
MRHFPMRVLTVVLLAAVFAAADASASSFDSGPSLGYAPRVPISALARPVSAIDFSRFHVSTMVSVGSGWGPGTQALQVTSLSYQFKAPVQMRVSIGNAWGQQVQGGSAFFLEGAELSFRPSASSFFQISYQNVRSPLQYNASPFSYSPYWAR